jgi:galactose mutarotase-like enzyme
VESGPEPTPLGDRDWDEAYSDVPDGARVTLAGRVGVEFVSGYPYAQVYSPAGADLIALEPMTAPGNALKTRDGLRYAEPGEPFEAVFRVLVGAIP